MRINGAGELRVPGESETSMKTSPTRVAGALGGAVA